MAQTSAYQIGDQVKITRDLRPIPLQELIYAQDYTGTIATCEGEFPYRVMYAVGEHLAFLPWREHLRYGETHAVVVDGVRYDARMLKPGEKVPEHGNYCFVVYGTRFRLPDGSVIFEQEMNCEKVHRE